MSQEVKPKPRAELLKLAESCGASLSGRPDGSESVTVIFSVEAWRKFDAALALQPSVPSTEPPSKRQYFYRVSYCEARSSDDADCLCWHDEGTGPLADDPGTIRTWRAAPLIAPTVSAPSAEPAADLREKLIDAIAAGLGGTYHCTRVWEAWHVGTMSQDDFEPVDESDTPAELAEAVLSIIGTAATAPAPLPEGFVGSVIIGHSVTRGGWGVYEETAPGEFDRLEGPFSSREQADAAMRRRAAPLMANDLTEELEKAHEARRQAQAESATLKDRMARVRLDLMRELREQGWTAPQAATASVAGLADFNHDIGADRFRVVKGSFWWHIRIGDSTGNVGKFHSKLAAEDVALKMLTAFRDGAYMQYQAMRATPSAVAAPEPVATTNSQAILDSSAAEPVATLHDDGCFTWKRDEFRLKYDRHRAGWRMDVYAQAAPVPTVQPPTLRQLAGITAPWAFIRSDHSIGIARAAIEEFCRINSITLAGIPAAAQPTKE